MAAPAREQSPMPPASPELITATDRGLWCEAGGFHVDPWKPVDRAVITHAHADHACAGCGAYLAAPPTRDLLRKRLGKKINAESIPFGERRAMNGATVSLHPAGHILGSAQVRVEAGGETWAVSGDYKTDPDPAAEPFEPVPCDAFISETTFALPIYRWPDRERVAREINGWWAACAAEGRTAVLLAYSLGKAQRVLRMLDPSIGPIGVHGAIPPLSEIYHAHGVALPAVVHANAETAPRLKQGGVVVAPPSAASGTWVRRFAGPGGLRTALVSGWMRVRGRRRWNSVDRGFVLSDHADWSGLLDTVRATGASRIRLTHGAAATFARYLREEMHLDARALETRYTGEGGEPAEGDGGGGDG